MDDSTNTATETGSPKVEAPTDAPPETVEVGPMPEGPEPGEPTRKRGRRKSPASTGGTKRKAGRPTNASKRAERVAEMYRSLGTALTLGAVIDPRFFVVGEAMQASADDLGKAWAQWAETSERVANLIDGASFGGGGLAVALAHAPLVQALRKSVGFGDDGDAVDLLSGMMTGGLSSLFEQVNTDAVPTSD